MTRRTLLALLLIGLSTQTSLGQPVSDLRFQWKANDTLRYKVAQETVVTETTIDEKTMKPVTTESRNKLALVRAWVVKGVDAGGIATLEMSIQSIRTEIKKPDGATIVIDSTQADSRKSLADYLDKPIVTLRMDRQGRIVEVKEVKQGSIDRLMAELPFRLTLPDRGPAAGQSWERPFAIKLNPPNGTGESYDFNQKFTCQSTQADSVVIDVATNLKVAPKTTEERIPLIPMEWQGKVYFSPISGRMYAARLTASAELKEHLGEGSKFVYTSSYNEDAVESPK